MVLGSVLIGAAEFLLVADVLTADDFSIEKHRRIFRRMADLHAKGVAIDRVTVAYELQARGEIESIDGVSYLVSLDDGLPRLSNIDRYVTMGKNASDLRRIILAFEHAQRRCMQPGEEVGEVLTASEQILREIGANRRQKSTVRSISQVIDDAGGLDQFGAPPKDGIILPWPDLNRYINPALPGHLIAIGARPGAGKTILAMQIAMHTAAAGAPAVVFSLEMTAREIIERCACNRGRIDSRHMRQSDGLSQSERRSFLDAVGWLNEQPVFIDETARTLPAISAALRRHNLHAQQPARLVVVDYLQLMQSSGRTETRNLELGAITSGLKLLAKEMSVTVLLLSQLSRASEKENREPNMSDMRDSGSIESDADTIFLLHRKPSNDLPDNAPVPVNLILNKQRNGCAFKCFGMLMFGRHFRFEVQSEGEE